MAWQDELKTAVRSLAELGDGFAQPAVEARFRTLIPRYYLGLIDPADPRDPIAAMAFASPAELSVSEGLRDPIGDLARQAAPRLTHRYPDRALLHVTNLCPMYCRYCFRKNLMNEREEELYAGDFSAAFEYVAAHPQIEELIFTGGDPWMLADEKLSALVDQVPASVKRLRFHTRMPVTLPSRVTPELVRAIQRPGRFRTIVVTHFNHPREITDLATQGLELLQNAGITVLNQSVLLRGVNDSATVLRDLFRGLGNIGVLPYYLHHCDLVEGAEHFRLSIAEGRKIWTELRGTLAGYLIPEYVLDTPGGWGKIPIGGEFVSDLGSGAYQLTRGGGEYRDPR